MDSFRQVIVYQRRSRRTDVPLDILQRLDYDVAVKILEYIDDPVVLIRASAVSHFWQHLVISNQIAKRLCLRLFPQLSTVVTDPTAVNVENLKHVIYANLARSLTTPSTSNLVKEALCASTTDQFPKECIVNTLYTWDQVPWGGCYWSSKGSPNPEVSETLTYRMLAKLCVVTEIDIKPFRAYFQLGTPIFSARAVRFRMGHLGNLGDDDDWVLPQALPVDDQIVWTYTSPEFSMDQDDRLQRFELPEPVLCIGGYMQVQLLDMVQRQEVDGLYYTCISHVKVLGKPLFPMFDVEVLEQSGIFLLKYFPEHRNSPPPVSLHSHVIDGCEPISEENVGVLNHLFHMLHVDLL